MKQWLSTSWQQVPKWQQWFMLLLLFLSACLAIAQMVNLSSLPWPKTFTAGSQVAPLNASYANHDEQVELVDPNFVVEDDEFDRQLQSTAMVDEASIFSISPKQAPQTKQQLLDAQTQLISGVVTSNFYQSAREMGLSLKQIQSMVLGFDKQFDLGRSDLPSGYLAVVLQKPKPKFLQPIEHSAQNWQVMAALYRTAKKDYSIFRANNGSFYSQNGQALTQSFSRLPLVHQARISSNFNRHRLHPVTGKIAPHLGVDFAVPTGTPVVATADGKVVKVGNHPLAGRYVVIKNSRAYSTRFLHLSQVLVRQGQNVSRGQRIGLSGNTGRTTGPHLHFELRKFGQAINPMTSPLPQKSALNPAQMQQFSQFATRSLAQMNSQLYAYQAQLGDLPSANASLFHPSKQPKSTSQQLFHPKANPQFSLKQNVSNKSLFLNQE